MSGPAEREAARLILEAKRKDGEKTHHRKEAEAMDTVKSADILKDRVRKLSATGAAKEKSIGDLNKLAVRDEKIVKGETRGKYAM